MKDSESLKQIVKDTYAEKELQETLDCLSNDQEELNNLSKAHKDVWDYLKDNSYLRCFLCPWSDKRYR